MRFLVVLHKDKDSNYRVTVPDLPGCFSTGDNIEQALDNTKEAITLHLSESKSVLLELFKDYRTQMIDQYMEEYKGGLFIFVEVEV